jgi:asparagine synthase (glutamine-hydrolysing)
MPGIFGLISKEPPATRIQALSAMLKAALHEPFYSSGRVEEDPLNAVLGWTCHRGSFSDCLPLWNEAHDVCLIFCGEHFADPSENDHLRAAGHRFSRGDATSLVHLYEELGSKFFEALNGTFSGLLLDLRENKAVLFNDRYGLGRIYIHEGNDGFYFGSEAKALLNVLPHLRKFDMRSLGEFFSCGCALQNRTLFEGISLLPPGSAWVFRPGQPIEKQTYFHKGQWEALPQLSPDDYYHRLKETFTRILPRYLNGEQPVALSLTGGLDSRMIIAAAPNAPGELPCFTFGGKYRDCEDVKVGRQVAELCQQPHNVIKVGGEFFPQFFDAARRCVYITDGAMDVSGAVGMTVNRRAREFALVRMTGNYGSEILRLNVAFKADYVADDMFDRSFQPTFRKAAETYAAERDGHRLSFIAFKQVPWHHHCRFAEENSQLTIRSPYLDNELVRLAYQAPTGLLLNKHLALRFCADLKPQLTAAPTDRGVLDRPAFVPEKIYQLWKERWPKAEYYFDYGMPQWLAKVDRALGPLRLERAFLGQQKYYHFRTWYRRELAQPVKEVLLDPQTLGRPYLNGRRVEQMVNAHTRGTGNYTLEIHKLMTSEIIQRELIQAN